MAHIYMQRRGYHLEPADERSQGLLEKIPLRKTVEVTVIQRRNVEHHRLWFALLRRIADWLGQDDVDEDVLNDYAKLRTGVVNLVRRADGTIQKLPGSIAFHRMDQVQFRDFFEKALKVFYEELGVPPKEIADLLLPKEHLERQR